MRIIVDPMPEDAGTIVRDLSASTKLQNQVADRDTEIPRLVT